ncbi:MAG: LuxR C-terminal-related transcriptional regulator [Thermomicrobiales bacterium]|nr:LuxR C-terminal-related transcriptional regulator [Thermomicrobiales bacterium]
MEHLSTIASLPRPLTPMYGRERESAELTTLLATYERQFVTLCGPGGIGKSRLALHLAAELEVHYPGGVGFLSLASCFEANHALSAIGRIFDVDWQSPRDMPRLVQAIGPRRILLVLDNLEQIPDTAPLLSDLMRYSASLSMIVTSQRRLGIDGERLFALDPLEVPPAGTVEPAAVSNYACVQLFVDHARRATAGAIPNRNDFPAIAEICRKLEGLPLAIQLAASRSNVLPPADLLPRLESQLTVLAGGQSDTPHRLRTMRNAIQWAYDLLDTSDQIVFLHLCLFDSGFDLDAVDAICRAIPGTPSALDALESLMAHSIVRHATGTLQGRFVILTALREFGKNELASTPYAESAYAVRSVFARGIVDTASQRLTEEHQHDMLKQIDRHWGTIRASVEWSLAQHHPDVALHLAGNLWRYAEIHGTSVELGQWLDQGLSQPGETSDVDLAQAWIARGYIHALHENWDEAIAAFTAALSFAQRLDQQRHLTQAWCGLGRAWRGKHDIEMARHWLDRAEDMAQRTGFDRAMVTVKANRAELFVLEGKLDLARELLAESVEQLSNLGDIVCMAATISRESEVEQLGGNLPQALRLLEQALVIDRELNSAASLSLTLLGLGNVWCALGDLPQSITYLEEAIATSQKYGLRSTERKARLKLARVVQRSGDTARTARLCAGILADFVPPYDQSTIESCLAILRDVAQNQDDLEMLNGFDTCQTSHLLLGVQQLCDRLQIASGNTDTSAISRVPLTPREAEVLHLLTQERSTAEIAETLFISQRTVNTHIGNIMAKLGVKTRTAAVARVMHTDLIGSST